MVTAAMAASRSVFEIFERQMLDAAKAEAMRPSAENLPSDGSLISRNRVDEATGERSIEWHGKRGFIKGLSQPDRLVERIVHRPTNSILFGRPFDEAG
jgi:hypothetical protein